MDDPYTTLGVARDATEAAIRTAYRKLAKTHHPDLNPGNAKAEERFKTIAAANELLSNPEKRGQFDRGEIDAAGQKRAPEPSYRDFAEGESGRRYGAAGPQSGAWSQDDLGDMFGSMFGAGRGSASAGKLRGEDEHYAFTATFLDAINGATRRLTLPDGPVLDLKLPPGTSDGQVLRLRDQGGAGWNGGTAGDALIAITVAPHPFFTRAGQDIRLVLPVTLTEAVLGGAVEVPTPGGPVRMRIPPGADSGTELRLRGRGVPAFGAGSIGDLYATLRVTLGKPDAALEAFLRDWKPEHPADPRHGMEQSS
jgi:DnaJ-class molecular chaperone